MSLHSRPIPAPKTPTKLGPTHFVTHLVRPEPPPAPAPTVGDPTEIRPQAAPSPTPEPRVKSAGADEPSRPWYRSEPWLAVLMVGFVPLLAAVIAPDAAQYPLIGVSVVALVIGAVMLVRQGIFRPASTERELT